MRVGAVSDTGRMPGGLWLVSHPSTNPPTVAENGPIRVKFQATYAAGGDNGAYFHVGNVCAGYKTHMDQHVAYIMVHSVTIWSHNTTVRKQPDSFPFVECLPYFPGQTEAPGAEFMDRGDSSKGRAALRLSFPAHLSGPFHCNHTGSVSDGDKVLWIRCSEEKIIAEFDVTFVFKYNDTYGGPLSLVEA